MKDKNDIQNKVISGIIALLFLLSLIFVQGKNKMKSEEEKNNAEKQDTYQFVDVTGVYHEAELLDDVPKCRYDYDRLMTENGYKYYVNQEGQSASSSGIDVSEYQTLVDWQQVKDAGIEFVMIRVGYRGYGEEGRLVEDAMYRSHMEGALNAGLDVGVYFFSQAIDEQETLEEASFVLERIEAYKITYPVVFDTEEIKTEGARTQGLSSGQYTENCITFCDAIEEKGYVSMIYANMKWMAYTLELEKLTDYAIWYADYEPLPQCPYEFRMWQYTETGQVPGVEENVDLDLFFEE